MSALSPATSPIDNGTMTVESAATSDEKTRLLWQQRIADAKAARYPFERTMLSDLAFAAGQHWLVYDQQHRRMRHISDVDNRYADRELYTADRITEYREAQLGELEADDDRPELSVVQEGETAEESGEQLNNAVAHAWSQEWEADEVLAIARPWVVDMGVAAIRCRWDPDCGELEGHAPVDQYGKPLPDDQAAQLLEDGMLPDGSLPKFKPVYKGKTCWEAYSALHILPPPGITHERYFPWEILARPVPITEVEATYPQLKGKLTEDTDIANLAGVTTNNVTVAGQPSTQRLRGHVWVYTCFEKPTTVHPNGYEVVLVSNRFLLADDIEGFQYQLPDGTPHSGIVYLHWWRRSDRFWSGSFITPLKDPQRIINRLETQQIEITDRGMPKTFVEKGSLEEDPKGTPHEIIELAKNAAPPVIGQGVGPGPWMEQLLAHQADNLGHASTLAAIRLGENPEGVDTYSQLALLNDNETSKRARILRDHRRQIARLVELGVYDIRKYWPSEKHILVAGKEDQIARVLFEKAGIPDFYMAKVAAGAPAPKSQGALLKMVDAIWAAAVQAWVAVNDGNEWVQWYFDSIKAGKPLDLPSAKSNTQKELAYLENDQMFDGQLPQVMDYDVLPVHLVVHREAEDQARAAGDMQTVQLITLHIEQHIQQAQANAAQQAAVAAGQAPPTAGAAGGGADQNAQNQNPAGAVQYQQPMAREPYPQRIPGDFSALARGQ